MRKASLSNLPVKKLTEFGDNLVRLFDESFRGEGPLAAFDSKFSPTLGASLADGVYLPLDIGGTNIRAYKIVVEGGKIKGATTLLDGPYEKYFGNRKDMEVDEFFDALSDIMVQKGLKGNEEFKMPLVWSNALSKGFIDGNLEAFIEKLPGTYVKNEPIREKARTGKNICESARRAFARKNVVLHIRPGNDTDFDCLSAPNLDVAIIASTGGNIARLKLNPDGTKSFVAHEVGGRCTGHKTLLFKAESEHFKGDADPYLGRDVSFEDIFCGNNLAFLLAINLQGAKALTSSDKLAKLGAYMIAKLQEDQQNQSTQYKERFGRFISKALRTKAKISDPSYGGQTYESQAELLSAAKELLGDEVTVEDLDKVSGYAEKHIRRAGAACGELIASSIEYLRDKIEGGEKVRVGIDSAMMEHYPYYYDEVIKRIEARYGQNVKNIQLVFLRSFEVPSLDEPGKTIRLSAPIMGGLYAFAG